jgi:isopenicillin-N epimerase
LRYLTLRWANRLTSNPRVRFHSTLEAGTYGLANVGIDGIAAADINRFLWNRYRIITTAITRDDYQGIRVTPNIYTTLEEIDTFSAAMEDLLKNGTGAV